MNVKYLVDTLTGNARPFAPARESAKVVFADERTLLAAAGFWQAYLDWETLREEPFLMPPLNSDLLPTGESLPLCFYSFTAAGDRIALRSFRTVFVLERGTMKTVRQFDSSEVGSDFSFSPDGATLAGSSGEGLRLVDVATGTRIWADRSPWIGRPVWSANGRRLAAADWRSPYVYVWSIDEPRWVARFPLAAPGPGRPRGARQAASAPTVALSPDGRQLAVVVGPTSVQYWRDVDAAARGDGEVARDAKTPPGGR
jgi:hypothetical protein